MVRGKVKKEMGHLCTPNHHKNGKNAIISHLVQVAEKQQDNSHHIPFKTISRNALSCYTLF